MKFTSWERSAIYNLVPDGYLESGRLVGKLSLVLRDQYSPDTGNGTVAFHIATAADVGRVVSPVIVRTAPAALARDAETTKLVHIDFNEPDLPWRYTPQLAAGDILRPWIVVLVGTAAELSIEGTNVKILDAAVLRDHNLQESHRWAHVQEDAGSHIGRVLSPRRLLPQTEYVAVLVSAFDETGAAAWDIAAGRQPSAVPYFHSWRFWTAEAGDFETLAYAIMPKSVSGLGRAPLNYSRGEFAAKLEVRGAITSLGVDPDGVVEAAARADLEDFRAEAEALADDDPLGRTVIGLPPYGQPWINDLDATPWTATLNKDARFRGTAGLGYWMGREAQRELIDTCVKQLGAIQLAGHLVGELAFGLAISRSLWERRLPKSSAQQVHLFSPIMRRMRTPRGTALGAITTKPSPLEAAVFSTAARRMLRRGTAVTRHLKQGFVGRKELVEIANRCPPPPEKSLPGLPHIDQLGRYLGLPSIEGVDGLKLRPITPAMWAAIEQLVEMRIDFAERRFAEGIERLTREIENAYEACERHRVHLLAHRGEVASRALLVEAVRKCLLVRDWVPRPGRPDGDLRVDPRDVREAVCGLLPESAPVRCEPPDLDHMAGVIGGAIDPHGPLPPARRRVGDRISGVDLTGLLPLQIPVGLDFPTWTLLRDRAREWILPGVGRLPKDSVVAMQTNPTFIDAYLAGLNGQLLSELHWRNMPIDRHGTPLLMFWGHVNFETGQREAEIHPLKSWPLASQLGDMSHQVLHPGETTGKRDLVIVFRTDLFRRYPSTLVYLARPVPTVDDALKATPDFQFTAASRATRRFLGPIFQGELARDIVFFAFDVDPETLDQYWLVLDEPPSELRFRGVDNAGVPLAGTTPVNAGVPAPAPDADAAAFVKRTIDHPSRVGIDGAYLKALGLRL